MAEFDADGFRERLKEHVSSLNDAFVDREDAIDVITLATLSENNFLFVGDPGTAKTALIECYFSAFEGTLFSALCGSFTTLDELVGLPDISRFKKGEWGRVTAGRLPSADYAFLDEVMKSNDGTINSLLKILNEREFEGEQTPLSVLGAATNWPEVRERSEKVEALYDRFVLRYNVLACSGDPGKTGGPSPLFRMLKAGEKVSSFEPKVTFKRDELRQAAAQATSVVVPHKVFEKLSEFVWNLEKAGVVVSNRRAVKATGVMQASAWASGRDEVTIEDFDTLRYTLWTNEQDIASVDGLTDSIDRAELRGLVSDIDAAIAAHSHYIAGSANYAKATKLLKRIVSTAETVQTNFKAVEGMLTRSSAQTVRKKLEELHSKYSDLESDVLKMKQENEEADKDLADATEWETVKVS